MRPQAQTTRHSIYPPLRGKKWLWIASCAITLLPLAGRAAITTYTWNGDDASQSGDSDWSDGFNWNGNSAPSTSGAATEAIVLTGNQGTTPDLDENFSIDSLTFSSTSNNFDLIGSSTLTLGAGGLTQNSPDGAEINSGVTVDLGASQTWSINDASFGMDGNLNLGGHVLTVNTAANTTASFSNIAGAGGLMLTGSGGVTLSGTNTYSSSTNVNGGSLSIDGSTGTSSAQFSVDGPTGTAATLSGSGALSASTEYIANSKTGTFTQTGGSATDSGNLYIGYSNGSSGTYTLSGDSTVALSTSGSYVGYSGTGTFTQTGGTHTVAVDLVLGHESTGNGTYTLSGGALSANYEFVGYNGSGTFTQSAGTNLVNQALMIGSNTGSTGTYNLNGGTLTTGSIAGGAGNSTFNFNGGTLQPNQYTASFMSGLSTANVQSGGAVINTNGHNITISQALVHDTTSGAPATDGGLTVSGVGTLFLSGNNTYTGGTNVTAGTLAITAGSTGTSSSDFIVDSASGAAGVLSGGSISAYNEEDGLDGSGTFTQTAGNNNCSYLYVGVGTGSSGSYNLSGSSSTLSADNIAIGYNGTGTFTQSGGSNNPSYVHIGELAGSNGTYNLSGNASTLSTYAIFVGDASTGTFNQSGGTNTISNSGTLDLGTYSTGNGTYNLSGGSLSTYNEYVGNAGTGTFTQTGGSNSLSYLYIGNNASASGAFNLGGDSSSTLSTVQILVGSGGTGTFNQSGGTSTISDAIFIGAQSTGSGTYSFSAGSISAVYESVGYSGTGTFTQSGGTNTIPSPGTLDLGTTSTGNGTYNLSAGSLSTYNEYVGDVGTGTFTQTGGSNSLSYLYIGNNAGASGAFNLGGDSSSTLSTVQILVGSGGTGTFNQSGGTSTISYGIFIGAQSTGSGTYSFSAGSISAVYESVGYSGTGTFTQSGGTNIVVGSDQLDLGTTSTGNGAYNLIAGALSTYNEYVGVAGTGTFTQSGGTSSITQALTIGSNSGSVGTYTLGGGALTTGSIAGGAGTSTFNFNGGTLYAGGNNSSWISGLTANVQSGGAIINTNGYNVSIDQPLLHDSALGSAPDGGLTKEGSGTLTLTTANTYTGGTTVTGGTLSIGNDNELGVGSAVTVLGSGQVALTNSITTSRTWNLGISTLTPTGELSITFNAATINNGSLGAATYSLNNGTALDGTYVAGGSLLSQNGTVSFTNITLGGDTNFLQIVGAVLNTAGYFSMLPGSNMNIRGAVNTQGASITGSLAINSGGAVSNSIAPLYLDGSTGSTVNAGGSLATTGTTIELGSLLTNNGAVTGTLDADFGSLATGTGTYSAIDLFPGGTYSPGNGATFAPNPSFTAAFITPAAGNQTSSANITLAANTIATVNSADQLSFTNPIAGSNYTLTKTGTGTLALAGLSAGALDITQGSVVLSPHAPSLSQIGGLSISPGASLDITDNALVVNYSGTSPLQTIQSDLAAAYDHGLWDLPGLTSSSIAGQLGTAIGFADNTVLDKTTFDGQSVSPDSILIQFTWLGDANLDGVVNSADLAMISPTGATWTAGDFNYDGTVNADDYALFMLGAAESNGKNISATLPEPAGLLLLMPAIYLLRRKRHWRMSSLSLSDKAWYSVRRDVMNDIVDAGLR